MKWGVVYPGVFPCFFPKQLHTALILAFISSLVVSLGCVVCPRYMNSVTFSTAVLLFDIYEQIWFELGVIRETTVRCSLIPVWMTLTFFPGHKVAREQNLCVKDLTKFKSFEWNLAYFEIYWFDETCTRFI